MSSPTQRTLEVLRKNSWTAGVVERWIPASEKPGGGIRLDYLNILDIIAIWWQVDLGVQCCSADRFQDHIRKLCKDESENSKKWLANNHRRLEVWGWRKLKGKGQRQWYPRIARISINVVTGEFKILVLEHDDKLFPYVL